MIKYARENRVKIIIGINNKSVLEGQNSTPTTLKNVGIQISACINVPLNYIYIPEDNGAYNSKQQEQQQNELVVQISENKAEGIHTRHD